jgi:hypothetical protein
VLDLLGQIVEEHEAIPDSLLEVMFSYLKVMSENGSNAGTKHVLSMANI